MTDVLSEILRSVRLRGGVFLEARLTAPWAVGSVVTSEACKPFMSRPSHLIAYHMMIEGEMVVSLDGEPAIRIRQGEAVLLPRNDAHVAASAPGIAPVDGYRLIEISPGHSLPQINHGGGGAAARVFCGFLGCEDGYNPLIAALPRVLVIDMREATSRDMVEASIRFAASELTHGRLADGDILSRLSELLLIEAVRRYAESSGGHEVGWIRALRDPGIGRALALIHRDIATPWTAEGLARESAMSRSAFMDRFTNLMGVPPITYITAWRMEAAKSRLRETDWSVARIGHSVGYGSDQAFSRAFKRQIGAAPSQWREQGGRG